MGFIEKISNDSKEKKIKRQNNKKLFCPYCMEEFLVKDIKFRASSSYGPMDSIKEGFKETSNDRFQSEWVDRRHWSNEGLETSEDQSPEEQASEHLIMVENKEMRAYYAKERVSGKEIPVTQVTFCELQEDQIEKLEYDDDGFLSGAVEKYPDGRRSVSKYKMCPHCQSLLPNDYGKYPIKVLSVLGTRASGKTVYLAQLIRDIINIMSDIGLGAAVSKSGTEFVNRYGPDANGNYYNVPGSTNVNNVYPPVFITISKSDVVNRTLGTIVLNDIAGEHCNQGQDLVNSGKFVLKSDGIILLLSPEQLDIEQRRTYHDNNFPIIFKEKDIVTETTITPMTNVLVHIAMSINETLGRIKSFRFRCRVPVAVTLSKSDVYQRAQERETVQAGKDDFLVDENHSMYSDRDENRPKEFGVSAHQQVSNKVKEILALVFGTEQTPLRNALNTFKNKEYFACAAIGKPMNNIPKKGLQTEPKRIAEPLEWMLSCWGWIPTEGKPFMNAIHFIAHMIGRN